MKTYSIKFTPFFIFILFFFQTHSQITPADAISQMQKGINLGNTHEPPLEAGWNNPKAEEYYFDLYKNEGFQCIRIPVRWDGYTSKTVPYKIDQNWLNRIETVVDWGLKRNLFIVINAHHEEWIKSDYSSVNKARFDSIWSQISVRFQNKSEKLIFEIINEPNGLTKIQNDDLHQRILSIIRKTNPKRLVIIQGHNWGGSDELIQMAIPKDSFLIGSFHSYDPYLFGLEGQGTWGTSADYTNLENKFKAVSNWSVKNKIPVFLGEFGSVKKCDYNSRMRHYRAYVEYSQKYGFAAMVWDDGGNFRIMERQQRDWNELKDILIYTNSKSPYPVADVYQDSIVRLRWQNRVNDNDSIIIQRKLSTELKYKRIAALKSGTDIYYDKNLQVDKYYNYRVISIYKSGNFLYSQPVGILFPVWIRKVRKPFLGSAFQIPGSIEAEDFDMGGEDFTYHDTDISNIAGAYRPEEGVDIYDRLGKGFHIGNVVAGEWYEYSVNIKTKGLYSITSYLASIYNGGKFQISIDTVKSEIITVSSSNSNLTTKPFTTEMYLYPGNKIMRFSVVSTPAFNIDKIVFDLKSAFGNLEMKDEKPFFVYQKNPNEIVVNQKNNEILNKIGLYSVSGNLLKLVKASGLQTVIPTNDLPSGFYIIQLSGNSKQFSEKIVINLF